MEGFRGEDGRMRLDIDALHHITGFGTPKTLDLMCASFMDDTSDSITRSKHWCNGRAFRALGFRLWRSTLHLGGTSIQVSMHRIEWKQLLVIWPAKMDALESWYHLTINRTRL